LQVGCGTAGGPLISSLCHFCAALSVVLTQKFNDAQYTQKAYLLLMKVLQFVEWPQIIQIDASIWLGISERSRAEGWPFRHLQT
jgi:hypothetical protein